MGFHRRSREAFDVQAIIRLNEEYGFKPHRGLVVSSREIAKIAKRYPEYATAAKETAKDHSSVSFQFWNEIGDPLEDEEEEV